MGDPENDVEQVIIAAIWQYSRGDPAALARTILEELWEAGYEVTHRPDMIPIRRNPGEEHCLANGSELVVIGSRRFPF